ncbi:hypothetical protein R3P38DRAFT_2615944 [Favolaschia claudopus]|uniref:Uncharacterized protein n=1 Tax=Favolaschia claudopus TaxID=2862362 RepID=A0AAW0CGL2_9AGAR
MGQDKDRKKQHIANQVLKYLNSCLSGIDVTNEEEIAAFVKHMNEIRGVSGEPLNYVGFQQQLRFCLNIAQSTPSIMSVLQDVAQKTRAHLHKNLASHWEKRSLVYKLNLAKKNPRTLAEFVAGYPIDPSAPVGTLFNPHIVWRSRDLSFGPAATRNVVLADTDSRPNSDDYVCSEANGFYRVPVTESVIFVDKNDGEADKIWAELIVLRDVFGDEESDEKAQILEWFQRTIDDAVDERRNVRPSHPGSMVQIGWNAGPFHARVFGLAKSYTKNLNEETRTAHDLDAIAAINVAWALTKAVTPTDVTRIIEEALAASGMPRIATRDVPEGTGFRLVLGDMIYSFPLYDRAPPEGYLTRDYSASLHSDPSYIPGACAISLNVGRRVDAERPPPTFSGAVSSRYTTRSHSKHGQASAAADPLADDTAKWPVEGGGNFVDMSLRVVVVQATGTLFVFDPSQRHGTTRLCGAHNYIAAFTFSSRIKEAFEKAKKGQQIEAEKGAGDGNFDFE